MPKKCQKEAEAKLFNKKVLLARKSSVMYHGTCFNISMLCTYISEDWFSVDRNIMAIARVIPLEQYLYIGCNLGLDSDEVKRIYQQNHANNINVIPDIMFSWRNTRARSTEDEKLGELLRALQDLELNSIVDKISDIYDQRK